MKREILLGILKITEKQQEALKREGIEEFEKLLYQRQQLMDQLDRLHKENPDCIQQKEEEILEKIIEIDTDNRGEYDRQYLEVQEKLKKLRSQQKVGAVYANPYERSQEEGIFFDKR